MPSEVRPRVVHGIAALGAECGPMFVVVGAFDGIHRGHLYLLRHLRREARRRGACPAVVTFDHHPDEILQGRAPAVLCDPDERLVRFARAGVEVLVIAHFDEALRRTPYDVFVRSIAERVDLAGFLMTPDAAFGHERRGTPEALSALGERLGFQVEVVPALALEGRPVRSTEIRAAVAESRLATARELLGRSHAVAGTLAADGSSDARLAFELPVALPPDGRYRVTVEPAWSLDLVVTGRPRRTTATVAGDTLTLPAGVAPGAGRLRVAFHGPARPE